MTRQAPPSSRYATHPASWYLLCRSSELRQRPLSKTVLGRQVVAFRTQSGQAVMLDGRCAHLGADLSGGRVVGETIRCPFHGWEYGRDGRCTHIPGTCDAIPRFAQQTAFPVAERNGYVFFFNGREPLFPLPFFFDVRPDELTAGVPFRFVARCTWYMFASHAFDVQHFLNVHDRELIGPPVIDCPAPFARRIRYTARVAGDTIYDRLLRRFAGRQVDITITTWGGTLFYLTGQFGRVLSRFLVAARPLEDGTTLAEGIVFKQRGRNALTRAVVDPLSLWVRRLFTRGYLMDEVRRLGHPHYSPATLIDTDRDMIDFFHWVVELPQDAADLRAPCAGNGYRAGADDRENYAVADGTLSLGEDVMKAKVLLVIAAGALLLATGHAREALKDEKPAPEDPAHEELRALKREMVEALNKLDIDTLITKLDKDVVVTWMDGTVSRGPAEVKTYLEQKTKGPNAVVKSYKTEPEVDDLTHLYGDTGVAYGHSKDTFVLNNGHEFTIPTRWTATLVKKDGKWLVASFHGSADVFDNPILEIAIKRTAMWAGGIAGLVGLLIGLGIMWLVKRRPA